MSPFPPLDLPLSPSSKLQDIEGQLRSLPDEPHEDVLWLLEDLQEAVFHYQVSS